MSRRAGAAAIGAAVTAGAVWTAAHRRDLRAVERDPEHRLLFEPPRGRELAVRSADGTELHVELFGDEDAPPIVLVHGWTFERVGHMAPVEAHRDVNAAIRRHAERVLSTPAAAAV